jgi:cytochrome b6-f complex iron-sulfur subunit
MKKNYRRDFLKRVIKIFFSSIGALFLFIIAYLYPAKKKEKEVQSIYIMDEEDLPKKGVKKVILEYRAKEGIITNKIFVATNKSGIAVFSPVCTHFGCLVNWDSNKKIFLCPCHGGTYDIDGNVISGPPPRPLTRLPLKIKDGKVYVDILV